MDKNIYNGFIDEIEKASSNGLRYLINELEKLAGYSEAKASVLAARKLANPGYAALKSKIIKFRNLKAVAKKYGADHPSVRMMIDSYHAIPKKVSRDWARPSDIMKMKRFKDISGVQKKYLLEMAKKTGVPYKHLLKRHNRVTRKHLLEHPPEFANYIDGSGYIPK